MLSSRESHESVCDRSAAPARAPASPTAAGTRRDSAARRQKARRKRVKQAGKWLRDRLADVFARQSLVEDTPVIPNHHFPFLETFADEWEAVRDEVRRILIHREEISGFDVVSSDQKRISKDNRWRTFILYGFGTKMAKNCAQAPVTTRLLERVPNLQTAWFSILAPGYHIPAHRGVTKGILRAHLGLMVPKERAKCRIRVGDQICVWEEGGIFVFDDTYEHEVWNDTDEERVILLFDFDRPMRLWGRLLNRTFVGLLKLTAYYQEPKRNVRTYEERFEAAVRRADANLERLSEPRA